MIREQLWVNFYFCHLFTAIKFDEKKKYLAIV